VDVHHLDVNVVQKLGVELDRVTGREENLWESTKGLTRLEDILAKQTRIGDTKGQSGM
jgi:hypothetical protein